MKKEFKELVDAFEKLSIEFNKVKAVLDGLVPPVNDLDSFVMNNFVLDSSQSHRMFLSELVEYITKHYGVVSPKQISHSMSRCGFKSHVVRINNKMFRVYYVKIVG
jgi:hypothetical protein